jgi:predicted lipid-binding transport protein (Tim44 family)
MRSFFLLLITIICTIGIFINNAEAKRFGGGKSFGMQRSSTTSQFLNSPRSFANNVQQPFSTAKKWLAPLAGLALGGLLASLLMGNGIGSGILTWLIVGSVIFLLFNLIRRKMQPVENSQPLHHAYQSRSHANNYQSSYQENHQAHQTMDTQAPLNNNFSNISNFNHEEFLRDAKVKFIRLQSAYDQKNLNDLREFTTPEVFAEIQLQLHERNNADNKTDVIHLDAELLEATTEFQIPIASVRFSGTLREDDNEVTLNETWHFRKNQQGSDWLVAGIQQP